MDGAVVGKKAIMVMGTGNVIVGMETGNIIVGMGTGDIIPGRELVMMIWGGGLVTTSK
jgi:hypothetical protein